MNLHTFFLKILSSPRFSSHRVLQMLYKQTGETKTKAACEYVVELCNSGAKFLVFAFHLDVLKALHAAMLKEKVDCIMILGETPPAERSDKVKRFQKDQNWFVIGSRSDAAGYLFISSFPFFSPAVPHSNAYTILFYLTAVFSFPLSTAA